MGRFVTNVGARLVPSRAKEGEGGKLDDGRGEAQRFGEPVGEAFQTAAGLS